MNEEVGVNDGVDMELGDLHHRWLKEHGMDRVGEGVL